MKIKVRYHDGHTALLPEKKLDSGYVHFSLNRWSFSQIPPGFIGVVEEKYIFQPDWNKEQYQAFEIVGYEE